MANGSAYFTRTQKVAKEIKTLESMEGVRNNNALPSKIWIANANAKINKRESERKEKKKELRIFSFA